MYFVSRLRCLLIIWSLNVIRDIELCTKHNIMLSQRHILRQFNFKLQRYMVNYKTLLQYPINDVFVFHTSKYMSRH